MTSGKWGTMLLAVHVALAAAVILAFALAGGRLARRLGQPEVIGEVVTGLLLGPAAVWLAGPAALHRLVPANVLTGLKDLADGGLVLFMVGVAHQLRFGDRPGHRRATGWVAFGAFVPPLCAGAGLGLWLLYNGGRSVRGSAPGGSFVLFTAVALAITAVPVLARILVERELIGTRSGRIALAAAIIQDTAGWLVLSVALSLNSSSMFDFARSMIVLAGGALVALGLRRLLRMRADVVTRHSRAAAVLVALVALAVALSIEHLGLTSILGAVLVGVAIPGGSSPWAAPVTAVARVGRTLVPLFFTVTGITVFVTALTSVPWSLVAVVTVLGVVAKVGGGYLGARLGGQRHSTAVVIGVLMDTRGLTELAVLQVGYTVGILPAQLFLAFVIMAVVTTALTGPLLRALDRTGQPHPFQTTHEAPTG